MPFKVKKVKKGKVPNNTKSTKNNKINDKYKREKMRRKKFINKIIVNSIYIILTLILAVCWLVYDKYLSVLPPISKLEEISIPESSIIYDDNKEELYTFYASEKRTYVDYEKISEGLIHAITASEDKTFFENSWFDIKWIIRSLFNYLTHKTSRIEWTSTISQQLIKNVFLSHERKIERKIKELYLSFLMNQSYSKEKILELYLNKISFGSNAFGIEQAAKTFFSKTSSSLSILESSILASLPKWPTYYSPYSHFDRLVWHPYINRGDTINKLITAKDILEYKHDVILFTDFILKLRWKRISADKLLICGINKEFYKKTTRIDKDNCMILNYSELLWFLNSINIEAPEKDDKPWYTLKYQTGRKDFVLGRMLEDNHISFQSYKNALIKSIWFKFEEYKEKIKYPYFVFYVKEFLDEKYGKDFITENGWLKIHTTINKKLQEEAENIIEKHKERIKEKYDANNIAILSVENKTWKILAYVGWSDFFDEEIDGNVDILQAKRQPWSTFKPFVYSKAIHDNNIGTATPVFDLKTEFTADWTPENYDGEFLWKMDILTALWNSRNIPAIKMYYLAWLQNEVIDYLDKFWIKSLNKNFSYWAPLAIWTWEMKPIELVGGYSVFANMGKKVPITPVEAIHDSNNVQIEKRLTGSEDQVIPEELAYIMNYMLSNKKSRPEFWNKYLSPLEDWKLAAKTGTSNKQFDKDPEDKKKNTDDEDDDKEILPWDLWTIWYSPYITTIVWVWNTDGSPMTEIGNWLEAAWPIWRDFMTFAHEWLDPEDWEKPETLEKIQVSTISWLYPPKWFDPQFIDSSYHFPWNEPKWFDSSLRPIKIDSYCNWKVTEETPEAAIKEWYYLSLKSINPKMNEWEETIEEWIKEWWAEEQYGKFWNIITYYDEKPCFRSKELINNATVRIKAIIENKDSFINGYNYIEIGYISWNPLIRIDVFLGDNKIQSIPLKNQNKGFYKWTINIPSWYYWEYDLLIRGIDSISHSADFKETITIVQKDKTAPKIVITNPLDDDIKLYPDQHFKLNWNIVERSTIRSINIYLDNQPLVIWLDSREFSQPINYNHLLKIWTHSIKIEATDFYFNKSEKEIELEIIAK